MDESAPAPAPEPAPPPPRGSGAWIWAVLILLIICGSAFMAYKLQNEQKAGQDSTLDTSGFDLSIGVESPPEPGAESPAQPSSSLEMGIKGGEGMKFGSETADMPGGIQEGSGSEKIKSGEIMKTVMDSNPDLEKAAADQ